MITTVQEAASHLSVWELMRITQAIQRGTPIEIHNADKDITCIFDPSYKKELLPS